MRLRLHCNQLRAQEDSSAPYDSSFVWLAHDMHTLTAGSKFGAIFGVVAAVVGPSIAVATWLFVTWNYRNYKKTIVDEVVRRFMISDMCKLDSALRYAPAGVLIGTHDQVRRI